MSETSGLLILSCIVAAFWKPKKTPMSGFFVKGKDGRIGITLTPVRKKKRRPRTEKVFEHGFDPLAGSFEADGKDPFTRRSQVVMATCAAL